MTIYKFFILLICIIPCKISSNDLEIQISKIKSHEIFNSRIILVSCNIRNNSNLDITLNNIESNNIKEKISLYHSYIDDKGIKRSRKINKILIPAKTALEFLPGKTYILIFTNSFTKNKNNTITLYFNEKKSILSY